MSKVRIGLAKVRLTFPHLFEKQPIGGVIDSEEKENILQHLFYQKITQSMLQ